MAILTELNLYPIKSCAGIALKEAIVTEAGLMSELLYDREWMIVDAGGEFVTQRTCPKMALIRPRIKADTLELRAPGMLPLEIPLALPDPELAPVIAVRVWDDRIDAYDCDAVTALWLSNALSMPCRLVRFPANQKRFASREWTGAIESPTMFSDGFPILVISEASLRDLNEKLMHHGRDTLPMNRFRPNIVIGDVDAFEEDFAESISLDEVMLKPVKPCARCPIPSVDQNTGEIGPDPLDIMQSYRANPKLDGRVTFGMNAILLAGAGQRIHVGQQAEIALAF